MTGWLLDTNVVSELRKSHCHPNVKRWADAQADSDLFLSRITIAEIRFGIERVAIGDPFRSALETWLEDGLRTWFGDRILDVDEDVLIVWRRLMERGRTERHAFIQPDLLIAATALVHGLAVATKNVDDFFRAGVAVLDPWTAPLSDLPSA